MTSVYLLHVVFNFLLVGGAGTFGGCSLDQVGGGLMGSIQCCGRAIHIATYLLGILHKAPLIDEFVMLCGWLFNLPPSRALNTMF